MVGRLLYLPPVFLFSVYQLIYCTDILPPREMISKNWSLLSFQFSSIQSLSRVRLFETPWIAACQASLSITNTSSSLKVMSIESVIPSSHLILGCPLCFLSPIPPSIRVFSNESALHIRWPKCWSLSFSIIPSKEHPGLISFRMGCLDLLAVQENPKSLLQHHSSKGCLGLVHGDDPERCYGEEGGRGVHVWEPCTPVVDSCQCMAKPIQYCKVK